MFKTLFAIPALTFGLAFMGAFEDGAGLDQIATEISHVADVDAAGAFDLGGGKTIQQALDSNLFSYDGKAF